MIIPPSWQLKIGLAVAKYGYKMLAGLLAVAIVVGYYYYWKHSLVQEGMDIKEAEWKEDNLRVQKEADEKVAEAIKENEKLRAEDQIKFMGALNGYIEYHKTRESKLVADSKRVLVPVKSNAKTCGSALPGKTNVSEAPDRRGQETEWAELGEEATRALQSYAAEVDEMAWLLADAHRQIAECSIIK